jgi:predicted amidohydrolase YtcJ
MVLANCPSIAALARGVLGNLTIPAFAPAAASPGGTPQGGAEPEGAVILRGGPILTMDEAHPVGEALAIRGSTILGVGTLTEVKRHYTPGTEIIDLGGHAVLPGFVEPHVHVLESALAAVGIAADAAAGLCETDPERVETLGACLLRELAMRGCTTVYDTGIGLLAGAAEHRLLDALAHAPDAPVRVRGAFTPELATALGARPGAGDERYDVVGISYHADGSIEEFTAALGEPYLNGRGSGELMREEAELREGMRVWHDAGWQLVVHSEGDRAIEQVLRCFEAVLAGHSAAAPIPAAPGLAAMTHRIERFAVVTDEQIARTAALGLSVSHAINQVYYLGERLRDGVLGQERAAHLHSLRRDLEHGLLSSCHSGEIPVANGEIAAGSGAIHAGRGEIGEIRAGNGEIAAASDEIHAARGEGPVAQVDPCLALRTATTRLMRDSDDVLGPFQQLTLDEALRTLTVNPARQVLLGDRVGMLRPGMLADLVVLDRDPRDVAPERLHELRVMETWLGGRRQRWG